MYVCTCVHNDVVVCNTYNYADKRMWHSVTSIPSIVRPTRTRTRLDHQRNRLMYVVVLCP